MAYIPRLAEKRLMKMLDGDKVIMVLGARQVGKTTLAKHVLEGKNPLFLNLDIQVEKQRLLASSSLSPQEALASLGAPSILVVDEAQRLPEIGRIVKGWHDAGIATKIILSGSSSLNLLDQSAESLTGRNLKLFLTPLLFEEIIFNQRWYSGRFSKDQLERDFKDQIKTLLLQAMVYGSYPEVVISPNKIELLTNLASDYLLKDILQQGLVKNPEVIKRLLMLLAHQIGSEVSVNELALNLGISRVTVESYLDLLEQTFVIFRLSAFSTNPRKEVAKSKKIFFWDTGIRNAILNEFSTNPLRSDIGRLWENWAIAEVAKKKLQEGVADSLYFWRSRGGGEVDLVVKQGEKIAGYEMKWSGGKAGSRAFSERYRVPIAVVDSLHPLKAVF